MGKYGAHNVFTLRKYHDKNCNAMITEAQHKAIKAADESDIDAETKMVLIDGILDYHDYVELKPCLQDKKRPIGRKSIEENVPY